MSFGIVFILLLMVVAAGVGLLLAWAITVPAFSSELNAWLGRTNEVADPASAREAQLKFALIVYSAPLLFGMLVAGLHRIITLFDRVFRENANDADRGFEM